MTKLASHWLPRQLLIWLFAIVAGILWYQPAYAADFTVDDNNCSIPSGNYCTIQLAVAAASNGDTIKVFPGIYSGVVNVNKDLTIETTGSGSWLLNGAFNLQVSNITIDGFTITGAVVPSYGTQPLGINVVGATVGHLLQNNTIAGGGPVAGAIGIQVGYNADNISFLDNEIASWGTGIYLNPSTGHTIEGNSFTGSIAAIGSDGISNVDIQYNDFSGNTEGLGAGTVGSDVQVHYNNFDGNADAIVHYGGATIEARGNWYGDASGPATVGPGTGDNVSANVTFCPWLDDEQGVGGFTNAPGLGFATSPSDPIPYCSIQQAVDASSGGQTVTVTAGVFNENVVINKALTLDGAGAGTDSSLHTIVEGSAPVNLNGIGIQLVANITGITIQDLTVQNFNDGATSAGIRGGVGNSDLLIQNVHVDNNGVTGNSAGGIYLDGPVDNVTIDNVRATNNRTRGIVIWNGFKTNITLTNNYVAGNNCCGIELQDGTASGITATGNTIENNTDSGMAFTGLTDGAGPNLISNNIIRNNGRFGIEIKLPDGSGLETGDGSIVISNNTVTRTTVAGAEVRDLAGIVVMRRGLVVGNNNVNIPTGVVVKNNTVSGFQQTSTSEGFCIVVEGNNMQVLSNTVTSCDVGIQMQAGHTPYTADTNVDGNQANLSDLYFGRGNSPVASGVIYYNNVAGNLTAGIRNVGVTGGVDARANWWGSNTGPGSVGPGSGALVSANVTFCPWLDATPGSGQLTRGMAGLVTTTNDPLPYCTIQAAVDASVDGDTVSATPGTYNESPVIDKSVIVESTGGYTSTSIVLQNGPAYLGALTIEGSEVVLDGFTIVGSDAIDGSDLASTNILLTTDPEDVTISNNRILVGLIGAGSNGDDGFGLLTTFSTSSDVAKLSVTNNIFEPVATSGTRAFYINPGVNEFIFSDNIIRGAFIRRATTQAKDGTISDNVLTGVGAPGSRSGGFTAFGDPNPDVYGHTTFTGNIISGTTEGIAIYAAENVVIEENSFINNDNGVKVYNYNPLVFDISTISITNNNFTGNTVAGVANTTSGTLDASSNWWGDESGPSTVGYGAGDPVTANVLFCPWLDDVAGVGVATALVTTTSNANEYCTIQAAINASIDGAIITAKPSTYNESPNVNKSVTLQSAGGYTVTNIVLQSGPTYLGALTIDDAEVVLDGFTIVGKDAVGSGLATTNIYVTSNADDVTIKNNRIRVGQIGSGSNGDDGFGLVTEYNESVDIATLLVEDNAFLPVNASAARAFYINPGVDEFTFTNNSIIGNFTRTSITQAKNGLVEDNVVTGAGAPGSRSRGLASWGYPNPEVYGHTIFRSNEISGTAAGIIIYESENVVVEENTFTNNDLAVSIATVQPLPFDITTIDINYNNLIDNTRGIVNNTGGSVDARVNWWGSASGPAEVGTGPTDDVSPGVTFCPWLDDVVGVGEAISAGGFVTTTGDLIPHCTIQSAIDASDDGDTVSVYPGDYSEFALDRPSYPSSGPAIHDFGLYIVHNDLTVQGVDANGDPITDPALAEANVKTNATNTFGYSGIFVVGDGVTIAGLEIQENLPSNNKTFEILGNDFTLKNSHVNVPPDGNDVTGALYFSDWQYNGVGNAHIEAYTIDNNIFAFGSQISLSSGTGATGDPANRLITNNQFLLAGRVGPAISFNGAGGVPWYVYPVGAATITGNDFSGGGMYIRARGDYDNAGMDWTSIWNDNDFDRVAVALVGPFASPFNVRAYSYTSGAYTFTNVRMIGGSIQPHISMIAQTGDTVYVDEGTYGEKVTLKSGVDLLGENESTVVISGSVVITGSLANVTAQDFTVHNGNATSYLLDMRYAGALTDIVFDGVTFKLNGDFIPVNGPGTYSNDAPIGNSFARPSFELIDGGDSDDAGLTFTNVVMDSGNQDIGTANELALLFFKSNSGAKLLLDNVTLRGLNGATPNLGAQFNTSPGASETAHIEIRNSSTEAGGNFYLSGFASATVEDSTFDAQGFALNGVKNATIAGNTFQNIDNVLTANGTQHRGLTVEDAWGTTGVSNLEIYGNSFNNITAVDGAIAFQRFTTPPSDLATLARLQDAFVRDNTFTSVNTPIYLNATYFGAGASLPMELMTVPAEVDQFALGTPAIDTITFVGDRDQYTVTLRAFPGYIHSAMQISDTAQTTSTLLFAYEILEWDDQTVLFVGPSGSGAPFNTIQDAVNAAPPGAIIEVYPGTYVENVNVNKSVTLRSVAGRDQTTIVGINGVGALGTVVVSNNTNGFVIDGFTIEGIDNTNPGIESAALYFQGAHSNATIINNEINANGDLAFLTEYSAVISGFLLDSNIFGGQTFTGTPVGQGSSQQFTTLNVPRQLVVMGGGAGGGNTSNITFTNNLIQGVAGGINGSSQEQGNTLVTLDANGATITGNTFAGTTTYFGFSLRTRGPNTVIEDNEFSSAGMGKNTGHIFTQNHPVPLATVIANNEFDKGSYVANANGPIFTGIGVGIASASAGQTVIALPGLYVENVAYNNAVSLQGAGSGAANLCGIGDPDTQTIIRATSGNLIQLAASGPSSANKLVIQDIRLELQATVGSQHGIGVATTVNNIKLERVRVIGNAADTSIAQRGLVVSSASSIANWEVTDSSFNCLFVGFWLAKETTAAASAQADNIVVTGSDFRENGIKGMYVEKLSNATISNNEFIDNNKALDKVTAGAAHSAGLDINLKFGAYSNISVVGNTFTGNGTGAGEGAALLIKARDDAPSYSSIPASLISVTVASNTITGNERGIRLGEPLKANNSPTQVNINHNLIVTNTKAITTNGSTYGGVIDWTTSPTVLVNRNALYNNSVLNIAETNGGTVDGTCNWYGTSAGPGNTVSNTVTATPWLTTSNLDGSCVSGSVTVNMTVVGSSSYASPTWAYTSTLGNFTLPQGGGSQLFSNLTAATYVVTQTVDPDYSVLVNCGAGEQSSNVATINLDMAENASCVFTNTLKPATLTITKTVINNHGGSATVSSFSLFVSGAPVTSGQSNSYVPGTYFVTESDVPNYSSLISGDCAANGSITLAPGGTYGCTITNDDLVQGSVNLSKIVVGSSSFAPAGGWQFYLNNTPISIPANGGGTLLTDLTPGTYTISEVVDSDYTTTLNCGAGTVQGSSAQISVGLGDVVSCTFTNTVKAATLTVNKVVINDNGGTAVAEDFPLFANGLPISNSVAMTVTPGSYTISENAGTYAGSFSGACAPAGIVTLAPGENKTCTITNNDPQQGTLNLTKVVDGSSTFAPVGGWKFYLNNNLITIPAVGGSQQVTNIQPGTYTISEVVDSDYTTSFNCGNGASVGSSATITFTLGQTVGCVFTNTAKSATLTVNKVVVNDNGGTAVAADFPLFVDSVPVSNGVAISVTPGLHSVTENAGSYTGSFSGGCSTNGTVSLLPGESKTCIVTNNDPGQGTLNLTKVVVGGSSFAPSGGWQFYLGSTPIVLPAAGGSTQLGDVAVGSYVISEVVDSDYTTSFNCGNGTTVGSSATVTFTLGQTVSCVFTNTAKSATLAINKVVVNDNGGTAVAADFPLFVDSVPVSNGVAISVTPGLHIVTENAGSYSGTFSGGCSTNGTVTLNPGDNKTCTVTNNDPGQGTLNLTKVVVGSSSFAPSGGWQFYLGSTPINLPAAGGSTQLTNIPVGSYTISEVVDSDYATSFSCGSGSTLGSSTQITFTLGQTVNCVFTNTVKSATLTVNKVVVNDNGGTAVAGDFPLFVDGTPVSNSVAISVTPGLHIVTENAGSYSGSFSGDCSTNGTVTLVPGDSKICTVTNNDPGQGTLNLTKVVVGSSAQAPAGGWQFYLGSTPIVLPAAGGSTQLNNVVVGSYTISEVVDSNYATSLSCGNGTTLGSSAQITFTLGQTINCVFTNTVKSATLTVNKVVVNDNGGTAVAGDFPLFANGVPVSNGVAISVTPGNYTISEIAGSYTGSFSGDCAANGTLSLLANESKSCTITNNDPGQGTLNLTKVVVGSSAFAPSGGWQFQFGNTPLTIPATGGSQQLTDIAPGSYTLSEAVDSDYTTSFSCGNGATVGSGTTITFTLGQTVNCVFTNTVKSATLTVNKVVVNDNGGTAVASDFPLFVDSNPVVNGVAISVTPGIHIVTENAGSYTGSFSGDCSTNGTVNLVPGDNKTCIVTNNDPGQGVLNLTKVVVGSNAFGPANGWRFQLGSTPITLPVAGGSTQLTDVAVGSYTISEVVDSDYTTSFSCGNGTTVGSSTTITFSLGQTINCVFTNTVNSATLTVNKVVINDNGGSAVVAEFPLFVNGNGVTSGEANTFTPGTYVVTEEAGEYIGTFSGDCSANGSVTLIPGDSKTCTVTNNDPGAGALNLTKVVVGSSAFAPATGWEFTLDETEITIPAAGGNQLVSDIQPGTYTLEEAAVEGYSTEINCGNGVTEGNSEEITFALGQTVSCVVTNTVENATLTVTKVVVNDDGGTAEVADFDLFVNGTSVTSGEANDLTPGTYTVSEDNFGGYSATFSGDCASNGTVSLAPGDVKSCTITNNDPGQGTVSLTKIVVGSSSFAPIGGWQFTLGDTEITIPAAGGTELLTNVEPGTYTISEVADDDYTTTINCGNGATAGTSAEITVALGETINCTFTNTLNDATLTVTKVVINDNGGTAVVADFPLFVNNESVTSGEANSVAPGTYTVSEENQDGYARTFSGDCSATGVVSLAPGESKSCTITNNDIAVGELVAEISLVKTVGVIEGVCANTNNITVLPGSTVYYCYTVTNTGNVALTEHTLVDNRLGTIIDGLESTLIPGQTVTTVALGVEAEEVINVETVNTATWTAVATEEALIATASATANVNTGTQDYEVTVTGTYTPPVGGGTTGGEMRYDINVLNTGTAILKNLQLSFLVPAGTQFDAGATAWSCADGSPAGTICTLIIEQLQPGEDIDLVLDLDIIAEIDIDQLVVELNAEAEETPLSPTAPRPIVIVGPDADIQVRMFMPVLDRGD